MNLENQLLQFEETGWLKAGVHDCSLEMLRKLTFTNPHRQNLGGKLLKFLRWPVQMGAFQQVYIGGGFLTNLPSPQDVDVILETRAPFGPEAFGAIQPFFLMGLDEIVEVFAVHLHFWMEGAPKALADYRSFFQYQRPLNRDGFDSKRKGIVRLSLSSEHFGASLESAHCIEQGRQFGGTTVRQENSQCAAA